MLEKQKAIKENWKKLFGKLLKDKMDKNLLKIKLKMFCEKSTFLHAL